LECTLCRTSQCCRCRVAARSRTMVVELIAENLQKLRSLDLSWCPRITDAALEYIACDLNQLEELTLD
ncbi:hypothetical protein L9F63_028073, partial [Diploptera punctata]